MSSLKEVCEGLPLNPLPPRRPRDKNVAHAPVRTPSLTREEVRVGVILYFIIYSIYHSISTFDLVMFLCLKVKQYCGRHHKTIKCNIALADFSQEQEHQSRANNADS